jgi:hypothetical protein
MGKGLGRGKGKGKDGCIFGELAKGLQCVLCLLCCVCISGPILIVVGISYLGDSTTDSRGELIQQWNTVASGWEESGRTQFTDLKLSVSTCMDPQLSDPGDPCTAQFVASSNAPLLDLEAHPEDYDPVSWTPLFYAASLTRPSAPVAQFHFNRDPAYDLPYQTPVYETCSTTYPDVTPCSTSCSSSRRRSGPAWGV